MVNRFYKNYVSSNIDKQIVINRSVFKHNKPYFNWLIKKLAIEPKMKILDFGCGNGVLLYFLKNAGYFNIKGVDISEEQIAVARSLNLEEVQMCDGIEFLKSTDESFDYIFLFDVLEHFSKLDSAEVLELVHSSLKESGKLILHVPNAEGVFGMSIRFGDLTHEECFTKSSISQLLKTCGFSSITLFEEKPIIHGIYSFLRRIIYELLTLPIRLLYLAETGSMDILLSRNILILSTR